MFVSPDLVVISSQADIDSDPILETQGIYADWSSDSTQIVYIANGGPGRLVSDDPEIYVATITGDTAEINQLTEDDLDKNGTRFSPDGTQILFYAENEDEVTNTLYTINTDGSELTEVVTVAGRIYGPTWSPNGTYMAFVVEPAEDEAPQIYLVNTDGTNLKQITDGGIDNASIIWRPLE